MKIELVKKTCTGSRCNKTFRVMPNEASKSLWCSAQCKLFHRDMGWKEMSKSLDEMKGLTEREELERKMNQEKIELRAAKRKKMNPFYRDDVTEAIKKQKEKCE